MKKCPLCGREFENGTKCTSCGVFLIDTETNQAVSPDNGKKKRIRPEKKKKSGEPAGEGRKGGSVSPDDLISQALFGGNPASGKKEETGQNKTAVPDQEESTVRETEEPEGSEYPEPEKKHADEAGTEPEKKSEDEKRPDSKETAPQEEKDPFAESIFGKTDGRNTNPDSGDTVYSGKKTGGEKNGKKEKTGGKITITLNPVLIAVAVVIILVIVAVIFIVRGMNPKQEDTAAPVSQEDTIDQMEDPDQADVPEETGPDLSDVTINACDSDYVEVSGHVEDRGGTLRFVFDSPQNIYLYDTYAQKAEVAENVTDVSLDPASYYPLDGYVDRQMTAGGSIWKEGTNIIFSSSSLIYAEPEQDDPGIHQYQIVVEDCTWYDAFTRSINQGGYLARISSPEEYQYIVDMLNSGGYTNIHFYLGGRRDDTGVDYYWVNEQNEFMGDCLNSSASWCSSYWYQNEPSFRDTGSDANGEIAENVMNLFCVSGSWYLNDSSDNLAGNYPDLLSGKVGYIIEYEE